MTDYLDDKKFIDFIFNFIADSKLSTSERYLLICFAHSSYFDADQSKRLFAISLWKLTKRFGVSYSYTHKILRKFVKTGLLKKQHQYDISGRNITNIYEFSWPFETVRIEN